MSFSQVILMRVKGTVLIVVVVLLGVGCNRQKPQSIPRQLLGTWATDAPGYKDRSLRFEEDYVLIGLGQDVTPSVQRVYRVESKPGGPVTVFTIHSTDTQGRHHLTVEFQPVEGGIIRLPSQNILWRRARTIPTLDFPN